MFCRLDRCSAEKCFNLKALNLYAEAVRSGQLDRLLAVHFSAAPFISTKTPFAVIMCFPGAVTLMNNLTKKKKKHLCSEIKDEMNAALEALSSTSVSAHVAIYFQFNSCEVKYCTC